MRGTWDNGGMVDCAVSIKAARVVVVMPNWLGDAVMATPFLRALRGVCPEARIAVVVKGLTAGVVEGLGSGRGVDEIFVQKKGEEGKCVRWLRRGRIELGVLLPNSFRSAWRLWRGGVKRRLGYRREMRGWLLTDYLLPEKRTVEQRELDEGKARAIVELGGPTLKIGSKYQPGAVIDYYNGLAGYLGAKNLSREMELGITELERREGERAVGGVGRFVLMVPGANFGASKCWPVEYFSKLADRLIEARGVSVVMASSPAEMATVEAIVAGCVRKERIVVLGKMNGGKGISIGALKEVVRWAELVVCNDTGPRHFAVAAQEAGGDAVWSNGSAVGGGVL